jgi:subtilisin family serine protease
MMKSIAALWLGFASLCALAPAPGLAETTTPNPRSLEYRLSWGLDEIGVQRAYRAGSAGAGVTVAMVDTGVSGVASLFARLSTASTDLVSERVLGDAGSDHGRQTAQLLAAARDGSGTMGVAYDATLLSIRADTDGSCLSTCSMTGENLARGITYAVDHGARVIGLPLASERPLPTVEAALLRAVNAGVLIVAAAGNEGDVEPVWPARYAADPRFKHAIIVAGASTSRHRLARWSNRAGSTADRYLLARASIC